MKVKRRKTIANTCSFHGIGFKTGLDITVNLMASNNNNGIRFIRTDVQDVEKSIVIANAENVSSANHSTTLSNEHGVSVSTVEHLMFSLFALDITDVDIHLNGPEIPLLDGSAEQIIFTLNCCGTVLLEDQFIETLELIDNIEVSNNYSKITATPSKDLIVEFTFAPNHPFDESPGEPYIFKNDYHSKKYTIGIARTFCTKGIAEEMMQKGILKEGCDFTNALVLDENTKEILTPGGMKCNDEAKKHKVLDFLGDLYLLGKNITGHFKCFNSGHELNTELLKNIASHKSKYIVHC